MNFDITDNHHLEGTAFGDPSRDPAGVHRSLLRNDLESVSSNEYGTRNWAVKYNGLLGTRTLLTSSLAWNHTYFFETPVNNTFAYRNYAQPTSSAAYTLYGGVGFLENNEGDNKQWNAMLTRNTSLFGGHQFDLGYSFNRVDYTAFRSYSGPDWPLPDLRGIAPEDVASRFTARSSTSTPAARWVA